MHSICLFCGAAQGDSPVFAEGTRALVTELVTRGISVVYGGGRVGLMGTVADAVHSAGGRITGVIPDNLFDKEIAADRLTSLHVTESMSQRKAKMAELSDGFIALPGGLGTLEEFSEVLSWAQLGLHNKPCGLFNIDGYFDPLIAFLDRAVERGFLRRRARALALVESDPRALVETLVSRPTVTFDRWND